MLFFVSDKDREGLSSVINKEAAKPSRDRGEGRVPYYYFEKKIVLSVSLINDFVVACIDYGIASTVLNGPNSSRCNYCLLIIEINFPFVLCLYRL